MSLIHSCWKPSLYSWIKGDLQTTCTMYIKVDQLLKLQRSAKYLRKCSVIWKNCQGSNIGQLPPSLLRDCFGQKQINCKGFLDPILTCVCGGFPTAANNSLRPAAGVWEFNSILILSTWRQNQIPQVKGSVPQDFPPLQVPVTSSGWPTNYRLEVPMTPSNSGYQPQVQVTGTSGWLTVNQSSHDPLLRSD